MPTLAGWLTGEQVPQEIIEQTLTAMGTVVGRHGGQPARIVQPGVGLITFSDSAYAMQHNDDPPVLDWVPDRRTLVYRRPLSGMQVLYYVEDWPAQGNLLFASEIKALLAVGVPRRLHLAALDALLHYGFIPAPWTAFKDIHVVPAGSILRWQRAKMVVNQAMDYHLGEPLPQADALDQLDALIDKATAGLLPPHEQLVALTNGDGPSALSTILATHHTQAPFTIATFGYTKYRSSNAERIAAAFRRPFLAVTGIDQPEFWTAALAGLEAPSIDTRSLALHQLLHTVAAQTGARVAISGLGAHILLGAEVDRIAEQVATEPQDLLRWYNQRLSTESGVTPARLWSQDAAYALQQEEPWEETHHARKLVRRAAQFPDERQKRYYLDLHLRLPDHTVHAAQQLATQERMVIRSPYLNTDVMDLLTRLPVTLANGMSKDALITKLVQRHMPSKIDIRSWSSLEVPTASLLRIADFELLKEILSAEALRATGIFDAKVMVELLKRKEVSRELLLVFTTQLLCRLFEVGL